MTEDQLEQETLGWLADVGYAHAWGPDIAPDGPAPERADCGQVLLVERLRRAIETLNPSVPKPARDDALGQVLDLGTPVLLAANRQFHRLLVNGVPVQYQLEGETRGDFVRLVDWAEPTPCKGWQAVAAESLSVWTEVPKENNVETALAYAATPDRRLALGKTAAGSLTWCAGAAYFVRDPEGADEPARLLRVTDAGAFQTVYESKATGDAFLSTPRCGGDRITVSAYSSAGDEQVSAALE